LVPSSRFAAVLVIASRAFSMTISCASGSLDNMAGASSTPSGGRGTVVISAT